MNNTNFKLTPVFGVLILLILSVVVYLFSLNAVWIGDDLRYQYQYTEANSSLVEDYDEFNDRIETVGDIVNSLTVHHKWVNGRDTAHFFVHLFCGILGQKFFACVNALFYILFIFLILKVCKSSIRYVSSVLTVSILVILCFTTRMTPAFQINYIWMFTLILGFLFVYLHRPNFKSPWVLILLSLFSFLAGSGHEGLNIGIGAAIVVDWFCNRKNYTLAQYFMAIAFGLGLIWLCLAPGNFVRVGTLQNSSIGISIMNFLTSVKAFYLLIIIVTVKVCRNGWKGLVGLYISNRFFWNAWAVLMIFNLILGISGSRQLFGEELMAIVLSVRILRNHAFPSVILVILSIFIIAFWWKQMEKCIDNKREWESILAQYGKNDGVIYTPEFHLLQEKPLCDYTGSILRNYVYGGELVEYHARTLNKQLRWKFHTHNPDVKVVPEYLRGKDSVDMGNQVVGCGDGVFLLIQSKKHPKDFVVKRSINISGIINRDYEPLKVNFERVVKETDLWRATLLAEEDITIMHISDNSIEVLR